MRAIAIAGVLLLTAAQAALGQKLRLTQDTTTPCDKISAFSSGMSVPASTPDLKHFAPGFAADRKTSGPDRIREAEVINGKVVVTDVDNATVGPILEAHAFVFTLDHDWAFENSKGDLVVTHAQPCATATEFPTVAMGPFAMVRFGEEQFIKSIGVGWMVGFRVRQTERILNLGLAYTIQQDVRALATGFKDGEPLPAGEEAIRYRSDDGNGYAIVVSFAW